MSYRYSLPSENNGSLSFLRVSISAEQTDYHIGLLRRFMAANLT